MKNYSSRVSLSARLGAAILLMTAFTCLAVAQPKAAPEVKKSKTVELVLSIPEDCKITINEKPITYEKFQVLMEFAPKSFDVDELTYRGGTFSALKLRSKE